MLRPRKSTVKKIGFTIMKKCSPSKVTTIFLHEAIGSITQVATLEIGKAFALESSGRLYSFKFDFKTDYVAKANFEIFSSKDFLWYLRIDSIQAIEVESQENVLFVLTWSSLFIYNGVQHEKTAWKRLNSWQRIKNPWKMATMKKIGRNTLVAYSLEDKELIALNISNYTNPFLFGTWVLDEPPHTNVHLGDQSFIYFTFSLNNSSLNGPQYALKIYEILPANKILLRYWSVLPLREYQSLSPVLSSFSPDGESEIFFAYGSKTEVFQIPTGQKMMKIMIPDVKSFDHEKYSAYNRGLRPGSYEFNFSLKLEEDCTEVGGRYRTLNSTLNIAVLYPMSPIKLLTAGSVQLSPQVYLTELFSGPITKLTLLEGSSESLLSLSCFTKLYPSIKFWPPVISINAYENKLYILRAYDKTTLEFDLINADPLLLANNNRITTFRFEDSRLSNAATKSCKIIPLKTSTKSISFFLSCLSLEEDKLWVNHAFSFNNATRTLEKLSEALQIRNPHQHLKNRLGENLLFQVFDPIDHSIFIKVVFFDLEKSGIIVENPNIEATYASITYFNESKFHASSGILSYDIWPHEYTESELYSHAVVALTKDSQLIISFLGRQNSPFSIAWDLTETSIFKVDKLPGTNPKFTKVKWVDTQCNKTGKNLQMTFLLMSSDFYTYHIKVIGLKLKGFTIKIVRAYAFYPMYQQFDAVYDSCSNVFVSYTTTRSDMCAVLIYPGNSTNASTFRIGSNSYDMIEVISAEEVECPPSSITDDYLYLTGHVEDGVSLAFLSGRNLLTKVVRSYYILNATKNGGALPSHLHLEGSNGFFSSIANVTLPTNTEKNWTFLFGALVTVASVAVSLLGTWFVHQKRRANRRERLGA